jgi:protease stability complex PrcB-like protein
VASVVSGGGFVRHPVAWKDVSREVGPARWARPTISVVHDSDKLAKLFQVALLPPRPKPPSIAFAKNDAVVITVGPRSSTGYSLHVVRVTQSGNLDILVRERTPRLGEKVEPVITYPYLLLVVPKLDKHVSVHYDGRY